MKLQREREHRVRRKSAQEHNCEKYQDLKADRGGRSNRKHWGGRTTWVGNPQQCVIRVQWRWIWTGKDQMSANEANAILTFKVVLEL